MILLLLCETVTLIRTRLCSYRVIAARVFMRITELIYPKIDNCQRTCSRFTSETRVESGKSNPEIIVEFLILTVGAPMS